MTRPHLSPSSRRREGDGTPQRLLAGSVKECDHGPGLIQRLAAGDKAPGRLRSHHSES